MVVEDEPLPEEVECRVDAIIQPEVSTERERELSLVTETFCNDFIDVMKGASREDDSVEPIHRALTSIDKRNEFMFPRKAGKISSYTRVWMVLLTFFFPRLGSESQAQRSTEIVAFQYPGQAR